MNSWCSSLPLVKLWRTKAVQYNEKFPILWGSHYNPHCTSYTYIPPGKNSTEKWEVRELITFALWHTCSVQSMQLSISCLLHDTQHMHSCDRTGSTRTLFLWQCKDKQWYQSYVYNCNLKLLKLCIILVSANHHCKTFQVFWSSFFCAIWQVRHK